MAVRKRGRSWMADFMLKGVRYRETFETEKAGEEWEEAVRFAIERGFSVPPAKGAPGGSHGIHTIGQLYEVTKRDVWNDRKSGKKLAENARFFLDFIGTEYPVKSISKDTIGSYAEHLRTKFGNSNSTVNRKVSALKVMLREGVEHGVISVAPKFRKYEEPKGSLQFLNFGMEAPIVSRLQHEGYDDIADLVLFLLDTGCRIEEAFRVQWSTIADGRVRFENRKNGQFGVVPLTKRATEVLERRRTASVDALRPFGGITYRRSHDRLTAVYSRLGGFYANITQPHHIFRHSCASRLAIKGVDGKRIMEWMDHSSLTVTQRYMKLAPHDLDKAVLALEAA